MSWARVGEWSSTDINNRFQTLWRKNKSLLDKRSLLPFSIRRQIISPMSFYLQNAFFFLHWCFSFLRRIFEKTTSSTINDALPTTIHLTQPTPFPRIFHCSTQPTTHKHRHLTMTNGILMRRSSSCHWPCSLTPPPSPPFPQTGKKNKRNRRDWFDQWRESSSPQWHRFSYLRKKIGNKTFVVNRQANENFNSKKRKGAASVLITDEQLLCLFFLRKFPHSNELLPHTNKCLVLPTEILNSETVPTGLSNRRAPPQLISNVFIFVFKLLSLTKIFFCFSKKCD